MLSPEEAKKQLEAADVFFDPEDFEPPYDKRHILNLNDVWCWACADGEEVPDEELPVVAALFRCYGWCGILYWVSERRGGIKSEFHDNNRFIEFVRQEEAIRREVPDDDKRAYTKRQYTIGEA